jgi:hypothetical protein
MKLLPITSDLLRSFVENELLAAHDLGVFDDDYDLERLNDMMEVLEDHFERSGKTAFAVYDSELQRELLLNEANGLDDAIEARDTQRQYDLTPADARKMHRAIIGLWRKLPER